jgi:hypothetical protein
LSGPFVVDLMARSRSTNYKEVQRVRTAAKRAARKSGYLCMDCGDPLNGSAYRCPSCLDKRNARTIERRSELKRKCVEFFGGACHDCGFVTDILAVYDFHHLDPEQKDFNPSNLLDTLQWEKILPELVKCVMLCSNCHRTRHAKETQCQTQLVSVVSQIASSAPSLTLGLPT